MRFDSLWSRCSLRPHDIQSRSYKIGRSSSPVYSCILRISDPTGISIRRRLNPERRLRRISVRNHSGNSRCSEFPLRIQLIRSCNYGVAGNSFQGSSLQGGWGLDMQKENASSVGWALVELNQNRTAFRRYYNFHREFLDLIRTKNEHTKWESRIVWFKTSQRHISSRNRHLQELAQTITRPIYAFKETSSLSSYPYY